MFPRDLGVNLGGKTMQRSLLSSARLLSVGLIVNFLLSSVWARGVCAQELSVQTFMRSDSNGDSTTDIVDPLFTLFYLYLGTDAPGCMDAADANDDGALDGTDAFFTLTHLFVGSVSLPSPAGVCGTDETEDGLDCALYDHCVGVSGVSTFETPIESIGSLRAGGGVVFLEDDGLGVPEAVPAEASSDQGSVPAEPRDIEEADIYKLVGNTLYIMNRYRGLQVVDISDLQNPELIGQASIFGWPQEMYVRGNTAYIVVTDYFSFDVVDDGSTEASSITPVPFYGSQLRIVDISDPTNPRVEGSILLKGSTSDSRMVGDVIYLVSHENPWSWFADPETTDQTVVTSVQVGDASNVRVIDREGFAREGWDHHIHVNESTLYLSSSGYVGEGRRSQFETRIQYVDIGDPRGVIQVRDGVDLRGRVRDRWQLDEYEGVLRVASAENWGNGDVYVSTIDVGNPDALARLGEGVLSVDETLTAARFDGDTGYVVTYRNIDPLFTVDLRDPSNPTFPGELVMTGWLDFIVPVSSRGQLVALGHEDLVNSEGRREISLAVSLIDVSDLTNPTLESRAVLDGLWAWVPGERDDFAKVFRTLPGEELILFPYSAWDRGSYRSFNGVQLLDWKPDEVVMRGAIENPGFWVERGIPLEHENVLTLSSELLQSADILDRDNPNVLGALQLARNVHEFALLPDDLTDDGVDYAVQLSGNWYRGDSRLTVTSRDEPNDPSPPAQVSMAAPQGRMFSNGVLTYVASVRNIYNEEGVFEKQASVVEVVDFSDPLVPVRRGSVELPSPFWVGHRSWYWGNGDEVVQVNDTTLAFHRYQYPFFSDCLGCDFRFPPGEMKHEIFLVDISDADDPQVASTVTIDDADWSWGLRSSGTTLYISSYRSFLRESDEVWHARYFLHRVDVSDPSEPVVMTPVNIPGMFVHASEDGETLYTHETVYDSKTYQSTNIFHALALFGDTAFLQSSVEISGRPNSFMIAGDAAFTTTHRNETIVQDDGRSRWVNSVDLVSIDISKRDDISIASRVEVPFNYAYLQKVSEGRAFVGSSAGVFVYDVSDLEAPSFDRFFRTQGWVSDVVLDGGRAFLPTGFYGVQVLGLGK